MMWRLGFFWDGFLEGDQGWGTVRFGAVLVLTFGIVAVAAVLQTLIFPDTPGWLESIPAIAASEIPVWLLRLVSNLFSWNAMKFLIIPLVPLTLAVLNGAQYIRDIYELNSFNLGLRYIQACLFGWDYPRLAIRDGRQVLKPDEVNLLSSVGGPGYIFVTPGSAVLCESLKAPSSVLGQGYYFITRFEIVKEIVDLTDQHGYISQTAAMTKDGIVVTIRDIHFRYRVWGGRRQGGVTGRSPEYPFPFAQRSIRNIVYNRAVRRGSVATWAQAVQGTFDGEISNYIRSRQLNEIITEGDGINKAREEIKRNLLSPGLRERMRNIGCELLWFDIGHFSYEEPVVEEEWINTWAADWEGRAEFEKVIGDSKRDALIEQAKSEAQADLLRAMLEELNASGLDGDLNRDMLPRLFLLKAGEALENMRGGYKGNSHGF